MRRYIRSNLRNFSAAAQCDQTGFQVLHKDLVPQMDYNGQGLYWTGFLVHKDFVDKPNPQKMATKIFSDPRTVKNPRPCKNMEGLL